MLLLVQIDLTNTVVYCTIVVNLNKHYNGKLGFFLYSGYAYVENASCHGTVVSYCIILNHIVFKLFYIELELFVL